MVCISAHHLPFHSPSNMLTSTAWFSGAAGVTQVSRTDKGLLFGGLGCFVYASIPPQTFQYICKMSELDDSYVNSHASLLKRACCL
jgi:hypothetical protein